MSAAELVSRHPDVDRGTRAVLKGTRYAAYGILRYLCVGYSVQEMQAQHRLARGFDQTVEQIASAVRYASLLAKDSELTPPEAAAFMRTESASMQEFMEVREQAAKTLEEIAEGMLAGDPAETGESERSRLLALGYGAALLYFQELPALGPEPAEETAFRDTLTPEDRALVEDFVRYRSAYWYWMTPEHQLGLWRRQIEQLEDDRVEIDVTEMNEYGNNLGHRDTLEDTLTLLSPASAGAVEEMIRPLDRRFEAATEHSLALIRRDRPWEPRRWWHYRIPKRRNEDAEKWIRWREERSIASSQPGPAR